MKRRLLSLLTLAALALSLLVLPSQAAGQTELTGGRWTKDGFTVTFNAPSATTATLMAASYVNGKMTQVKTQADVKGGQTVTFNGLNEAYLVRVFAIDPTSSMPVCDREEVRNPDALKVFQGTVALPTADDTVTKALSSALSAYASSSLALDRYGSYFNENIAAAPGGSQSPTADLERSASTVLGLPRRPDQGGSITPKLPSGYIQNLQHAAGIVNDLAGAAVRGGKETSELSALELCRQATKACAVLNAIAEDRAEDAQLQAAVLMAAGPSDDQLAWARNISALYDAKKGNQKLAQLARDLGCDARRAYHQLVMAQNILQGHYANVEGDLNEFWEKTMIATKAGCKVGLFVCATIATGGAAAASATAAAPLGYISAAEAAGIVVGAVDCTIEITSAGGKIILGPDSKAVKSYEDFMKPVSDATLLFALFTGGGSSAGEKLACLGDLGFRAKELYDSFTLKKDADGNIVADVLTLKAEDGQAVKDLAEKLLDVDTGFDQEPSDKTVEEVLKDFTEDRPIDDETLEKLLDETEVDKDLKDVVEDFNEEVDREIEEDYKDVDDDDPSYPERPPRIVQSFDEDGNLRDETCYDSRGELLWAKYYNTETKVLSNEAVYSDLPDGTRMRTWTRYFNEPDDLAAAGGPNRINWIEHSQRGENDVTYETPYYGAGPNLTFNTAGTLVARSTEGCTEVFDNAGNLSVVTYYENEGTISTTTTYSYYTYQPKDCKFDPTGHLQEVKVIQRDTSNYMDLGKTLYWEKWEIRSWDEGSGTAHGYLNNVIHPSGGGGDGYIQVTWTPQ